MRSVQARRVEAKKVKAKKVDSFENISAEEQLERNRKLAALLREWENDPSGHDLEFWPILKAELERHD